MTRRVSGTAKPMAFAATAVLLTASSAAAQSPARSSSGASTPGAVQSPGSSAAPRVEVTQAAGGTTITVGTGSVFVGQSASAADIALTEEQTAVAREELTGSKIGIVGATTDPWSVRAIQGIQAAADALGVTVVDCLSATYSKKPTCVPREGGKQQQIVALIDLYPMTFGSPKKLVKQGFVDVVVGGGPARDGSVAVRWTDAGIGAAVGRTAATWLTAHWPDVVPTVHVIGDQDYGFAEFL
ncbi:MAG: hypothetical protein LH650_16685, partial [Chloroflexi bacterium]|nr:hypothetical protein [Chloroflexota bacterium]